MTSASHGLATILNTFFQNFYFITWEKCNIWSPKLQSLRTAGLLAIIRWFFLFCFVLIFIEVNSSSGAVLSSEEEEEHSTLLRVLRRKKLKIYLCSLETKNVLKRRKHNLISIFYIDQQCCPYVFT